MGFPKGKTVPRAIFSQPANNKGLMFGKTDVAAIAGLAQVVWAAIQSLYYAVLAQTS
ncbi:MAG TPA: hypothetical protein PLC99_21650 [Verrucomicrobiota bacterium]|nr:hypothetical protein [Verrucomicrobiota bacterium]